MPIKWHVNAFTHKLQPQKISPKTSPTDMSLKFRIPNPCFRSSSSKNQKPRENYWNKKKLLFNSISYVNFQVVVVDLHFLAQFLVVEVQRCSWLIASGFWGSTTSYWVSYWVLLYCDVFLGFVEWIWVKIVPTVAIF